MMKLAKGSLLTCAVFYNIAMMMSVYNLVTMTVEALQSVQQSAVVKQKLGLDTTTG